ncbi:unnamed protein product [Urochloa humidicola]
MASRTRSSTRCLASLVLPLLFFSSLFYLSTRQPLLDIAVREEAAGGRKRLVVDRAAATVEANASVTTDAVAQASDVAAVAAGDGNGSVLADAPPAAGNANATTDKAQVSGGIAAVATGDTKVVTDAPPASGTAAAAGAKVRTEKLRAPDAAATAGSNADTSSEADPVVFDFRPYVLVYKSGRVHRFHGTDTVPPGVDALTGVASRDVAVAGTKVTARLYLPSENRRGKKKKLPVVLYFHGGAFVIESPFSPLYHAFLNILVHKAGAVAVSVHYRLAPEHPLPAAYDDAWAALQWTISNCLSGPERWLAEHGDATRIFLAATAPAATSPTTWSCEPERSGARCLAPLPPLPAWCF